MASTPGQDVPVGWVQPTVKGDVPTKRSGHSLTLVGDKVLLFGGLDHSMPAGPNNEVFHLEMRGENFTWHKKETSVDGSKLVIIGGFRTSTQRLNDLYVLDTKTMTWSQQGNAAANKERRRRKTGGTGAGAGAGAGAGSAEDKLSATEAALKIGRTDYMEELEGKGSDMTVIPVADNPSPDAPTPRGAHSACLIDRKIWVFGGYGGAGYQRTDFNDMYSFDVDTMAWSRIDAEDMEGEAPAPRAGHTGLAVKKSVLVYGGWSASESFDDLYTFDTETKTWSEVEGGSFGVPRWFHGGIGVEAVPNWQVLVFGGSTPTNEESGRVAKSQGDYSQDVMLLDTGRMKWSTLECEGKAPRARADTALVYDPTQKRVVVFGGWANRWFNDCHFLNVAAVIGPPYAVTGIEPAIGPVTGGTAMVIEGLGYEQGATATVRFTLGKKTIEGTGTCVSATRIELTTPNFEDVGPGTVTVRVSLRGQQPTITWEEFVFFDVTEPSNCLAFGPGVLSGTVAGTQTEFYIQARDRNDQDRITGGDEWDVVIKSLDGDEVRTSSAPLAAAEEETKGEEGGAGGEIVLNVADEANGKYLVTYTVPSGGQYSVSVEYKGTFGGNPGFIRASPFTVTVMDPSTEGADTANNRFRGPLMNEHVKEEVKRLGQFTKKTMDGLTREVPEDSLAILLDVKTHLHNVAAKHADVKLQRDVCQSSLNLLTANGSLSKKAADKEQKRLDAGWGVWESAHKQTPITRASIQPLVKVHGAATKGEIQAYEEKVQAFAKTMDKHAMWQYEPGYDTGVAGLAEAREGHRREMRETERMSHLANMFEFPTYMDNSRRIMKEVKEDHDKLEYLWQCEKNTRDCFEVFDNTKFVDVNADRMEDETKRLHKALRKDMPKKMRDKGVYRGLDQAIKDFLNTCPLVQALTHKSMRPRHWTALMETTGVTFTPPHEDPNMLLKSLLDLKLHTFSADVEEITDQALKEEKMEMALAKLAEVWAAVNFVESDYKEGSDIKLLAITEDDFDVLENDQLTVQGMMASRFLATFETEVTGWQKALSMIAEVLLLLNDIQRTWSYLEPLFIGSEEVKRELPETAAAFAAVDSDVKSILREAGATKNVRDACNREGLYDELERVTEQLEQCKKALADYLDTKRRIFPRFYFVSEADLLDILSNGNTPSRIIHHIMKVLLATSTLELDESGGGRPVARKFIAGVGVEEVDFKPPLALEGKVEIYLQDVLQAQKDALAAALKEAKTRERSQGRLEWIMHKDDKGRPNDPSQVMLVVLATTFSSSVDAAFDAMAAGDLGALKAVYETVLEQITELVKQTHTKLDKANRQRVMTQITMDAHSRDVLDKMLRANVTSKSHFMWQSQLKQVYDAGRIRLTNLDATFNYGFEYLGNGARLVVTPLTDRIYVTATQALNLKMGCAPAGPAGTGKTETTKDLASALAKCCYVFNCSPEMDYQSMGNIFKGLAASGSWGCFDEFNRLVPEVLSVCSVQFKAVCDAIRADKTRVVIEGDEVDLDPTCGVFITMNPGYVGRAELPEGLKALFRPMTVMVPDLVLICENMMMAEGFVESKVLASKFYGLYSLLGELLSKQLHYDWGLRAVKSVLVVAGGFKRAEPDLPEQHLLMRALRDFNTPKIVQQDEVVFMGLLGDLFPGIDPPRMVNPELDDAVEKAAVSSGLHPEPDFLLKVVQLEELLAIRHCVFVMGPPGAGKSTCWKTLAKARTSISKKTKYVDINPKSVSTEELYGYIVMATREWKDGLLSKTMRDLGQESNTSDKWIVLDGDLDTKWIESMNSVMDDNKMLTLASNERIPLKANMRMLFEIRDLRFASPATVSRAGIIYISTDKGSQWRSLVASWVEKLETTDEVKTLLHALFEKYCKDTIFFIKKECKPMVSLEDMNLVTSLLRMLNCLLTEEVLKAIPEAKDVSRFVETYFVYAAVWAFGCSFSEKDGEDYKQRFSEFWRGEYKTVRIPSRETVFDYWLDPAEMKFDQWKQSPYFREIDFDSRQHFMNKVTVPTPETVSITFWLQMLVQQRCPCMLVGYAGCGKTALVNGLLADSDRSVRVSTTINFNFYTSAQALQPTLEAPLEKKTGSTLGPPGKAAMVYFVDDLNLPEVDIYDTQSAVALLRQHVDYGHWYDRNKLMVRNIQNCQYLACLNPTAGSFEVNPRLQRHFVTFAIGFPGPTSLHTIYNTFLNGHLKHFAPAIQDLASSIVTASLGLHGDVSNTFRKSAINFHYEFNIRHLSNVFAGLLMAQPDQFDDPAKFVMLWLHESERVYGDRLVSLADLSRYMSLAQTQVKKRFPSHNMGGFFHAENADPLVFSHFAESVQDKVYDRVTSMDKLRTTLEETLAEYNEMFVTMNLVLFEDAIRHVCRICRIILNPQGHALLVGVGGSGKQSLSRLSSFVCSYTVTQIVISGTYSITDLKDDIKVMYNKAGMKEEGTVFLFTDSQISNERFLVYINDMLASGNIPDLYQQDEKDEIVNAVTSRVKAAGLVPDAATCWQYFMDTVRANFHIILSFSPVTEDFRTRCKKFPALINSTVIDWFQPWPVEALYSVGKRFLADVDLGSDAVRGGIEKFLPFSFDLVNKYAKTFLRNERRYVYTTPKSYLELLKLYKSLLARKRETMGKSTDRLTNGLQKLRDTAEAVVEIEAELKIKLADAEVKKTKADAIATDVAANKAVVEEETAKANIEAEKCTKIQQDVSAMQKSAAEDLAKAEPAVEAAMAALDTLNKKELGECKTMLTPPKGVDDVFGAVVVLLAGVEPNVVVQKNGRVREKDRNWDAAKKALLGNINAFIDLLKSYKGKVDAYEVPDINWREVRSYLALEHFNVETIKAKNTAAAGLCAWVVNLVMYRDILVTVEPKRQALRESTAKLNEANAALDAMQKKVAELETTLAKLTEEFNQANAEKQAAINLVEEGERRLSMAKRLTTALADENVRWAENIEVLNSERVLLIGDVLLSSAFISYIGPFTKKYRQELLMDHYLPFLETAADGERVPMSAEPDPRSILTDEAEVAQWNSEGLPSDRVSVENACIVNNTARWPLMIDPQLQGIKWVREREKDNNLTVLRLGQKNMLRILERAIDTGMPVLIENMGERIDAVLNPVIARATIKKGHKEYLMLGDKEVEFHKDFRLYLHTKLSNPHYPPEVQAETALINFTVTELGLEDQLLSMVVQKERPDLAELRADLIAQQNSFKIKMKQLEDDILQRLASAEGDITSDVELIEGLEDTKRISRDISKKQRIAQRTEVEINRTSEKYRPVAARGSLVFFLMNELFRVHTYYIYSLNAFVIIFLRAIDLVSGDADPMKDELEALRLAEEEAAEAAREAAEEAAQEEAEKAAEEGVPAAAEETKSEAKAGGEDSDDDDDDDDEEEKEETAESLGLKKGLSDEQLARRCCILMDSVTKVSFLYVNRGLFEVDKLMVAAQLTFKVLVHEGQLDPHVLSVLVNGKADPNPGNSGPLSEWMPEIIWAKVKALESVKPQLEKIGDDMQELSEAWERWFDEEKPELVPCPGTYKTLDPLFRLLILRAMRPDRIPAALTEFVRDKMGEVYVNPPLFDMAATYSETGRSIPVFFVLFPGVDPTVWVEELGKTLGFSIDNGKFLNISMGQGQEKPAETAISEFARDGGWLMLQNVHLMQSWLPTLERQLELCAETAHEDFRCYISAEPPAFSYQKNMPESLMQSCVKVSNEAPADLRSNLTRSWAYFSQDTIDACKEPTPFKACLITLCFYHAIVLGRRRFGQQGWSKRYSFNQGDLTVCADVLGTYINNTPTGTVPWEDMRYVFGQIMYGGHITDAWDRRCNNTYLDVYMTEALLSGTELAPGFKVPDASSMSYTDVTAYLETALPPESPPIYGLHPNAEIGYLTSFCDNIFQTILVLGGAGGGDGGDGSSGVRAVLDDLLSRTPENFVMIALKAQAEPLMAEAAAPYVLVVLQECERMNRLLSEVRRSLIELRKGLDGQLNMSDPMEDLMEALSINQVPGRNVFHKTSWEKLAWASKKNLESWFQDVLLRVEQLERWSSDLITPYSLWLPGLFNPMAFVTAIMQVTARETEKPLDKMSVETHITTILKPEYTTEYPEHGRFVHGLYIEGARWPTLDELGGETSTVGTTTVAGHLVDSKLKELMPQLPLVYLRAVEVQPEWEATEVGYLRHDPNIFECPVYTTTFRGPTYVLLATLHTIDPKHKWIHAGVAIIMQLD